MKLIATLAISATILAAQSRSGVHTVTAVRHWSLPETTRVAVEVTGDFEYRTERLHNPERIYFDILDSRPRIANRRVYSEQIQDKLLEKLRAAETAPGVTRVVLDLTGSVDVTTSQLTNPNRLIIELRAGAPTPVPVVPPLVLPPPIVSAAKPDPPAPPAKPAAKPAPAKSDVAEAPGTRSPAAPPVTLPAAKPAPVKTEVAETAVLSRSPLAPAKTPTKTEVLLAETSKGARRASNGNTSLVRTLGLKLGRVVIDPGHGGHDQGTEGRKGLLEKDLVLDVSMRLGKLIEDRLGAEVIYTRADDTFIPLEARTAIANDRKADLFLSIHANSSPVPRIAGVETYYRNFTTAKDSLDLASRENATSQKSIAELEDVIHRMMLGDKVEESKEFAGRIQGSLYAFSSRNIPGTKDRGVKKAPFLVLLGAKSPSVLVEIGFLSNPREESLLRKPEYRQKLAEALFRGVSRYADSLSHFQVAKAGS